MEGGENASIFNVIRLGMRLKKIQIDKANNELSIMTGDLKWAKEPKYIERTRQYDFSDCSVYFKQDTDNEIIQGKPRGNFHFYKPDLMPPDVFNDFAIDKYNRLRKPKPDAPFFMSLDPTNYGLKKMISAGSQNALMCFILPNTKLNSFFGKKVSHRLCMQYLCRRDKPDDTVWDVVKAILYFGCYLLCEGNMPAIATRVIELGLGNYIWVRNKDSGAFEPYKESNKQKYYVTSNNGDKNTIDEYVLCTKDYLGEPKEGEFDDLENLESEEVLSDLMRFAPENTREFDAGVSFMMGIMGIESYIGWKHKEDYKNRYMNDKIIAEAFRAAVH